MDFLLNITFKEFPHHTRTYYIIIILLLYNYYIKRHSTMEDKILRTINTICLNFPPFPLSPKQCCSLCTPVDFTLS